MIASSIIEMNLCILNFRHGMSCNFHFWKKRRTTHLPCSPWEFFVDVLKSYLVLVRKEEMGKGPYFTGQG